MKTTDIIVGADYAHETYKNSPRRTRVTVIETRVARKEGYGYGSRTINNGVKVTFHDGGQGDRTAIVPTRELVHDWATQERIDKQAREFRLAREAQASDTRARRANIALRIDTYLNDNGEARTRRYVQDKYVAALKAVGFEVVESDSRYHSEVLSAFAVGDFMDDGEVGEKVVTALLAGVAG